MSTINDFGDGTDGAYTSGNLTRGDEHNFTTFTLNASMNFDGGTGQTIVYVQGDFTLGSSAVINAIVQSVGADPGDNDIFGGEYNATIFSKGAGASGGGGGAGGDAGGGAPSKTGGAGGGGGSAGVAGSAGANGIDAPPTGGTGGGGGAAGSGTPSANVGGGGGGGGGGGSPSEAAGDGGGGATGGNIAKEQPTILFIVGGDITIDASAVINNSGGTGGVGSNGTNGQDGAGGSFETGGGGGGAGGGGGGGGGAGKVLFFYNGTYTNDGTFTATAGVGGAGGTGGTGGTGMQGADNGVNGSVGATGSTADDAGVITQISRTTIKEIFSERVRAFADIDFEGGESSTERGFVWDTSSSPEITDNKVVVAGSGAMDSEVSGLPAETTIFLRSYATNPTETTYGEQVSFDTIASFFPKTVVSA